MQGNVFKVLVEQGADVEEGALVCIIEAMKMENEITAHKAGKIAELPISEGDAVTAGDTLAVITGELSSSTRRVDWLRIPSISAGERDEAALREAAEWAVAARARRGRDVRAGRHAGRRAAGRRRAALARARTRRR